jgi:hypothetical protein
VPDIDYGSPGLWKATAYVHAPLETDIENFKELGYSEEELLALLYLRGLRRQVLVIGLSLFITIEGRPQSGKSRLGAGLGCLFSEDFKANMQRYIVRNAEELLGLIYYIRINKIKFPVIMVDEAGAALSSAEWLDSMNIALMKTFNVIGWLKPTIIFIAPIKDFILKGVRSMSNLGFKVFRTKNEYAAVVPYNLFYDSNRKRTYHVHPVIKLFGIPRKLKVIKFSMPPNFINEKYEEVEQELKPGMLDGIRELAVQDKRTEEKARNRRSAIDIDGIVAEVVKNYQPYELSRSKPGAVKLDPDSIIYAFKKKGVEIPLRASLQVKRNAEMAINTEAKA